MQLLVLDVSEGFAARLTHMLRILVYQQMLGNVGPLATSAIETHSSGTFRHFQSELSVQQADRNNCFYSSTAKEEKKEKKGALKHVSILHPDVTVMVDLALET